MDHHRPFLSEPKDQLVEKEPNMKVIYFAIATTGVGQDPDSICEIAAMGEDDESPWSVNILPSREFTSQASAYNGYTLRIGTDGQRHLFNKTGKQVETSPLKKCLDDFILYLLHKAEGSHTTMLLGWNSCRFHMQLLLQALKQCGLSSERLENANVCYGDPLPMIKAKRENFPQLSEVPSLKLPDIYNHMHQSNDSDFKTASCVVQMLKVVMSSLNITEKDLKEASYMLSSASKKGVTSESMMKKIAVSEPKYRDFAKVYRKCRRKRSRLKRLVHN